VELSEPVRLAKLANQVQAKVVQRLNLLKLLHLLNLLNLLKLLPLLNLLKLLHRLNLFNLLKLPHLVNLLNLLKLLHLQNLLNLLKLLLLQQVEHREPKELFPLNPLHLQQEHAFSWMFRTNSKRLTSSQSYHEHLRELKLNLN
jgi:hypothetical protein